MAVLPQYDPDPTTRSLGLQAKLERYAYAVPDLPAVPRLATLPEEEVFDEVWTKAGDKRFAEAEGAAFDSLTINLGSFSGYDELHRRLPSSPAAVVDWSSDRSFANQRLAGPNPLVIRKVTPSAPLPAACIVSDEHAGQTGVKLDVAIDEGRLFVCDYAALDELPYPGQFVPSFTPFPPRKRVTAPIAVFYWDGDAQSGHLRPLAIQTRQEGPDVFTPKDNPLAWTMVKLGVQIADAHLHQYDSHVARTHLVSEAFKLAAERQLAEAHPLLRLLRPHLRFVLAINKRADAVLLNEGGYVDQLMSPSHAGSMRMIEHFWHEWRFRDVAVLPRELARRGMDHAGAPGIAYPYRDDGIRIYDEIRRFVGEYLRIYYRRPADVAEDDELRLFLAELTDPDRIGLRDLVDGPIDTLRELVDIVTGIIWTAGPQHAAVNFPQWDYLGHVVNMPLAAYAEPPIKVATPSMPEALSLLPPNDPPSVQTGTQVAVMYFLGTYRYDMLGYYQPKDFDDAQAWEAVARFQCRLAQAGGAIFRANQLRAYPYPYLLPWNIPNSTSV